MKKDRICTACGALLAGPFGPEISLTWGSSEGEVEEESRKVSARSWVCPGCGLVHWYAEGRDLDKLLDVALADEPLAAKPGTDYERRTQMLRMLRRVRRM